MRSKFILAPGLTLEGPQGKNDGSVQGKSYFSCAENHGMFVRPTQVSSGQETPVYNTRQHSATLVQHTYKEHLW